jgi:membrane protein insertase Oxa1/YidC/SpoIIIJ
MSSLLHGVLVEPLTRIYEIILSLPPEGLGMGWRIVFFSVLLNLLLAPLYYEMDKRSRHTRALKQRVAQDVARMRRHFKGRERYFYVRAVHRQHGYHPLSYLAGSADLLVQVVVFFTVYQYLSGHAAMAGATFGPLRDLSKPDGLLGGINLLPFVMTALNVGAVFAYVEDRARRTQALGLAALFLVLLYNSPAGLVLYWTTNNVFALVRNVLQRVLAGRPPGELRRQLAELQQQA